MLNYCRKFYYCCFQLDVIYPINCLYIHILFCYLYYLPRWVYNKLLVRGYQNSLVMASWWKVHSIVCSILVNRVSMIIAYSFWILISLSIRDQLYRQQQKCYSPYGLQLNTQQNFNSYELPSFSSPNHYTFFKHFLGHQVALLLYLIMEFRMHYCHMIFFSITFSFAQLLRSFI